MVLNPDDAADWPAPLLVYAPCQWCGCLVNLSTWLTRDRLALVDGRPVFCGMHQNMVQPN